MKTLKALRITSILDSIFCFFCIVFVVCLILNQKNSIGIITAIGIVATFGWMLNPAPVISFVLCLVFFFVERRSFEARQFIGKKYIFIFIWPVITTLFYLTAGGFLVAITGGA